MGSLSDSSSADICLDIFGQQPRLNIYTQICLCYSAPNDYAESTVIGKLTAGLTRLTASFPWIGGRVVCEGTSTQSTGTFKIQSSGTIPRLVVKDLRQDNKVSTMHDLQSANYPMKRLDEAVFAPRNTFSGADLVGNADPDSPVFLVQVNLLIGGFVLTFLGQHQAMDMTGQAHMMYLLSKACCGDEFSDDELVTGNLERASIIPLLDNYTHGPELSRHLATPKVSNNGISDSETPRQYDWASFVVSPESLVDLKTLAVKTLPSSCSIVSTDDALSAFVWQSIMRARSARLPGTAGVQFARAVDVRRYVNVAASYPGLVQNMTYATQQLQDLVTLPLGQIACTLRCALDPETTILPFHTRALATYLHSRTDKSGVAPANSLDLTVDVIMSSWAKTNCYDLDFDLGLGYPDAVRRPKFTPLESFVYFMPRKQDGEIAVAMCLSKEDMERLVVDERFTKYARYDG